jgi:hypothetical protein
MIKRREFIAGLGSGVAWPLVAKFLGVDSYIWQRALPLFERRRGLQALRPIRHGWRIVVGFPPAAHLTSPRV